MARPTPQRSPAVPAAPAVSAAGNDAALADRVGAYLREIRGAASVSAFARKIGTTKQAWDQWEKGVSAPGLASLHKIARGVRGASARKLLGL